MEFVFLRHGQTDWNLAGRLQGRSDRPLNATGREQAQAATQRLTGMVIDAVVSSPLQRAQQTAEAVATACDLPLTIEPRLVERNFGMLEGRLVRDLAAGGSSLDIATSEDLPDDAEPWHEFRARVADAVLSRLHHYPDQRPLFVGHYGVISALCQQLLGQARPSANAIPYRFYRRHDQWIMDEVGHPV